MMLKERVVSFANDKNILKSYAVMVAQLEYTKKPLNCIL